MRRCGLVMTSEKKPEVLSLPSYHGGVRLCKPNRGTMFFFGYFGLTPKLWERELRRHKKIKPLVSDLCSDGTRVVKPCASVFWSRFGCILLLFWLCFGLIFEVWMWWLAVGGCQKWFAGISLLGNGDAPDQEVEGVATAARVSYFPTEGWKRWIGPIRHGLHWPNLVIKGR